MGFERKLPTRQTKGGGPRRRDVNRRLDAQLRLTLILKTLVDSSFLIVPSLLCSVAIIDYQAMTTNLGEKTSVERICRQ